MDAHLSPHRPHRVMPGFSFELGCDEPPEVVWGRLWDLARHTAAIPLTAVATRDGGPLGPGSRFTGRTAVGPLGFDDDMVVRCWAPPRHAEIEKVGRVLRGRIEVTLIPQGHGCRVTWVQTFGALGVPAALARAVAPVVGRGYRRTVRRIIEATPPQPVS